MNNIKYKIYLLIELLLLIALVVFQIITISNGYLLNDKEHSLFIYIAIFHVLLTFISFIFTSYLLITNKNNRRIIEDLFMVYFLFALISDIFFSFTNYIFIGHITFIICYLTFMFIRRAKIFEYIMVLFFGIVAFIVLVSIGKLTLTLAIDCFLAPILLLNMVMCVVNYIKNRGKNNLLLMIALILIVISDSSIGLTILFSNNVIAINILCLIIWPTYIVACCMLNTYFLIKRNNISTE